MRNKWLLVMMIPAFLFVILFLYFPLAKGVVMAFQNYNMFDLTNLHFIGLDNFKAIITDPYTDFWQIMWNTLIWLVFSLIFQFLLGFTLALLLKKPFWGRGIYSGLVFYAWALSGFAIGLIWSWLFNGQFGLFNDFLVRLGLIDTPIGFLSTPGLLEPKYLPAVEAQGHSITMILINVASCIKKVIDDPELDEQIDRSLYALEHYFIHPEFKALLEMVGPQGQFIDTINGRLINPGHCIETSWFLLDVAANRGGDEAITRMALTILDWSWEWGWDKQYGGIINFRDCKNYPPQDYSQDMKFWWPQTEAIIATLYAYKVTGDERYLNMHTRISDWTYAHFPDTQYGEWFGYLHRDGSVAQPAKGNLFKGPFHIPRMMTKGYALCLEMLNK